MKGNLMPTLYAVGHNMVGYLPESDVWYARSFDSARQALIEDMDHAADSYEETGERGLVEELSEEVRDLKLSSGPEWSTIVGDYSYWVNVYKCSDDEYAELIKLDCVEQS
jgi:hypothetical protein